MSDLVKRLRGIYPVGPNGELGSRMFPTNKIQHEAADCIEELERECDAGYRTLEKELAAEKEKHDAVRAELTNLQIAFNDWKVLHSNPMLEAENASLRYFLSYAVAEMKHFAILDKAVRRIEDHLKGTK